MEVASYFSGRTSHAADLIPRNFLLFIPANTPNLRAVLSYYTSTVTVNAEGDVHVSDDNVEGLGKHRFPRNLYAALFGITRPSNTSTTPQTIETPIERIDSVQKVNDALPLTFPWDPGDITGDDDELDAFEETIEQNRSSRKVAKLTDLFPDPGYFLAGGVAGVVSRTATAPLDRLKVYLIAQVGVTDKAITAAKSGAPVTAAKTVGRPLIEATQTLWRMGGMRSLFAGKSSLDY